MIADSLIYDLSQILLKGSSTTCSQWAQNYVVLGKPVPGPMSFETHPWEQELCDQNQNWKGMKAAQMGLTNVCLVRSLFNLDILRNDVLYLLPKKTPDAADFSKSKFDPLLEFSPHLQAMFSNVKNVGHKQANGVNFYLRGARSRSGLKSISVGLQIYDEYDEMPQINIPLAEERSSGYKEEDVQEIKISTPTFPKFGIHKEFKETNQKHYFFKCPNCYQITRLIYPESLVLLTDDPNDLVRLKRSYLRCPIPSCHQPLPENKKIYLNLQNAFWKATVPDNDNNGYTIDSFYSIVRPLHKIAKKVLEAKDDEIKNQELHNSILALPYISHDAAILPEHIEACKGPHINGSPAKQSNLITMGVDQGHKVLYYEINEWLVDPSNIGQDINSQAVPRVIATGIVPDFPDLAPLLERFQILHTVIDIDPYERNALVFAERYHGHINLCRFVHSVSNKNYNVENNSSYILQVNRTVWLDISQNRFLHGANKRGILLPKNISQEYQDHIKNLVRKQYYDQDKNIRSKYFSLGADHYALARVYSEIALPLAISHRENRNIKEFL